MSRNLTIDIGNTKVKLGYFEGEQIVGVKRFEADERLSMRFNLGEFKPEAAIWCSTAAPDVTHKVIDVAKSKCPDIELIELSYKTPMPISLAYRSLDSLGRDRIATAVGAWGRVQADGLDCDVLVIDAGTAITYDLVLANGTFVGGNISPGMMLRFSALHEHTGRLPLVEPAGDIPMVGYDTDTAIRSGVLRGIMGEARDFVATLRHEHPNLKVVVTGGDAPFIHSTLKDLGSEYIHDLAAEGLNRILLYNQANENC